MKFTVVMELFAFGSNLAESFKCYDVCNMELSIPTECRYGDARSAQEIVQMARDNAVCDGLSDPSASPYGGWMGDVRNPTPITTETPTCEGSGPLQECRCNLARAQCESVSGYIWTQTGVNQACECTDADGRGVWINANTDFESRCIILDLDNCGSGSPDSTEGDQTAAAAAEVCGNFPPVGTCDEIAAMFISEECDTLCSGARDYVAAQWGQGMEHVCAHSEVFMCMNEHTPGVCTQCMPAWGSPPDWGSPAQCTVAAGAQRLADDAARAAEEAAEEAAEPEDPEDSEPEDPEGEDPEDDDCDCNCQFRSPEEVMCCQLAQMSTCATPPAGDLVCCNSNGACSDIAGAICECSNPVANRSPSPSPSNSAGSPSPEIESNSAGWCAKRTVLTSMAIYSSMAVLLNDPV